MDTPKPRYGRPTTLTLSVAFDEETLAALDRLVAVAGLERDALIRGAIWYAFDSEFSEK